MQATEVYLGSEDGNEAAPVTDAWVYWRVGETTTILRTDRSGQLWKILDGNDRVVSRPRDYGAEFRAGLGSDVRVYYSHGARPIPTAVLKQHDAAFFARKVSAKPTLKKPHTWFENLLEWGQGLVSPNTKNVVVVAGPALVAVPKLRVVLETPREERLWPVLWELPTDHANDDPLRPHLNTAGLAQGAALWTAQGALSPAENSAVTTDSPLSVKYTPSSGSEETIFIRPRERGLKITGRIDKRATAATLRLVNEAGETVKTRAEIKTDAAQRDDTPLVLGAVDGNWRAFSAEAFLVDPVKHFGPVSLVVWSDIPQVPTLDAFSAYLCGFQIALVDDYPASHDGKSAGTVLDEHDEVVIVDFRESPHATAAELDRNTRARRMVKYELANELRDELLTPQMPLWMAELQIVGLDQDQLADLMSRHYNLSFRDLPSPPPMVQLNIDLEWTLKLSWEGIDSNLAGQATLAPGARPNQQYRYELNQALSDTARRQRIELMFSRNGKPCDKDGNALTIGADRKVPGVFRPVPDPDPNAPTTVPAQAPFPIDGRRLPAVSLGAVERTWGRVRGGTKKKSVIIEYQPLVVNADGEEIIRGGDGRFQLDVRIGRERITHNVVPAAPEGDPDFHLPRFRICGKNPTSDEQVRQRINHAVEAYFNAHQQEARVAVLPLGCWQQTARAIFHHENGDNAQFDVRRPTTRRQTYEGIHYGHQRDMPLFGPPHGYGFGQIDLIGGRGANDDEVWSFVKNIEGAVSALMGEMARAVYNHLSAHIPNPVTRDFLAVYRRSVVRKYNGGTEFVWSGGEWKISPSLRRWKDNASPRLGPYPNLLYCNQVLGTAVTYWTYTPPGPPAPPAPPGAPPPPGPPPQPNAVVVLPEGDPQSNLLATQRYTFCWDPVPITFINAAGANYGAGL
jgi:hypothetical protein